MLARRRRWDSLLQGCALLPVLIASANGSQGLSVVQSVSPAYWHYGSLLKRRKSPSFEFRLLAFHCAAL